MKNVCSILLFLFIFSNASAQDIIKLNKSVAFLKQVSSIKNLQQEFSASLYNGQYYLIIQLDQSKKNDPLNGVQITTKINENTFLATVSDTNVLLNQAIKSIGQLTKNNKFEQTQFSSAKNNVNTFLTVSFFGISKESIKLYLHSKNIQPIQNLLEPNHIISLPYQPNLVTTLADLPFVFNIRVESNKIELLNDESKSAHSVTSVTAEDGRNLSGRNVTVGHGDLGYPEDHLDLISKSINRYTGTGNFHGNHTSGIMSGAGIINEKYKGVAFKAPTINALYTNILVNTPSYITDYNLVATNNSYYSGLPLCPGNGAYNSLSVYVDQQTFTNPSNLHVFASGNEGTITCSPYLSFYGTVKSGLQTAKNAITVGNMNTDTYTNAPTSSRGPTLDGRIKPEIVAKGTNVTSTVPVNIYDFTTGGTSMAAPVVTGAVALLQERHKQLHSNNTGKSDLIKALLCNSADDLGNAGPDFTYGFGMLNVRKSIEALEQVQYFNGLIANTSNENTHSIVVPANVRRLKVMLYWIDKEGNLISPSNLINDLDLTLREPNSTLHNPYILNSAPGSVHLTASEGIDRINNIEQCIIANPATGNHEIRVRGFNIAEPNQQYVVVYCFEQNGITVDYPFGNEKWVPGETEKIRWTAFGEEANNFTVEYSDNNGGSWTLISNAVPSTDRSISFPVPATATTQALVRVSRNGTAYSDVSNYNFTVLGVPNVTLTNICEGAVEVTWNTITSATSYDVMIRDADSMKLVANTTALNYIITGLPLTEQWITVRAVNGTKSGRRAIAQFITPNGGACSNTLFNNDLKLVSINTPNSGRHQTNNAAQAIQDINVTIKNLDDVVSNTSFDISYSINNGVPFTQTITPTINAGAAYSHTFPSHAPTTLPADYNIKVWVSRLSDNVKLNDTAIKLVRLLPNPALTLPFTEDFESTQPATYFPAVIGLLGNDKFDFNSNVYYGRGRTFVNTGFARSGKNAVTLDQLNVGGFALDTLKGTFNLSNYIVANHQLRADLYIRDQGQEPGTNNKIWVRGADSNNWIEAFDLNTLTNSLGQYKLITLNLNDLFNNASPIQNFSTSFQLAVGQQGGKPSTIVSPFNYVEDGYSVDDIKLIEAVNDIALQRVVNPIVNPCNLSTNTMITVQVKNYSGSVQNNIPVSYRINNGAPVTELIGSINPGQTLNYTFSTTADLSAYIDYSLDFWVRQPSDNYTGNDSITKFEFHNSPLITNYPYLERFESNNGNWYVKGINSSWQWGTPAKPVINKAPNGTRAWVTSLTSDHNNDETGYLISPCFDLSALSNPTLSFSKILRIEDDCPCDYAWMEYSTNAGLSWQKLGAVGQGTNWYDNAAVQAWQLSKAYWHAATIPIPTNSATTKFRFVMQADGGVTYAGLGIDDIHIYASTPIYNGSTIASGLTQNVSGSSWVHFDQSSTRVASINANGNNLGTTEAKVYRHTGAVRNSNNQYYANRNIVLMPTTQPSTASTVRFYFTDAEVDEVLNATGCAGCTKPADAYEFGITKYSGPVVEENGDLSDNSGAHQFILPGDIDIIPYENGYYAEYNVSSFSEFWLNNGGVGRNEPLPTNRFEFTAQKINNTAQLIWAIDNEDNIIKYEVEKSTDGIRFQKIGEMSKNILLNGIYKYTDATLSQNTYYRIKMVYANSARYSVIKTILFNHQQSGITIWPNPVRTNFITINSKEKMNRLQIVTTNGKVILTEEVNDNNIVIPVQQFSKGIYFIKILTSNKIYREKIIIQ